jgi:hypothetical protein
MKEDEMGGTWSTYANIRNTERFQHQIKWEEMTWRPRNKLDDIKMALKKSSVRMWTWSNRFRTESSSELLLMWQ